MENYSTVELHAEIYYAEANLLLSFLTFIQVSITIVHMLDCVLVGTSTSAQRSYKRAPFAFGINWIPVMWFYHEGAGPEEVSLLKDHMRFVSSGSAPSL